MPFWLVDDYGGVYVLPASMSPAQLHVGGAARIRALRGYGSDEWVAVLDGIREPQTLDLVGLLHTDRDEATIQSDLDELVEAAGGAVKLQHVDHDGGVVQELELLGCLPVTTSPDGIDGTLLRVTLPLIPAAADWGIETGAYSSG